MLKLTVHNWQGKAVGEQELSEGVFGAAKNDALVSQVYLGILSNRRNPIAHTKDRAERAGSGKKPWRQKGTGRARVGSVRNPLWRKGGVVFGPTKDRNFKQKINQSMRSAAARAVLAGKLESGKIILVEKHDFAEPKTKLVAAGLRALKFGNKSLAFALAKDEQRFSRAVRNLPRVSPVTADTLSVVDMLDHEYLLLSKDALSALETRLASAAPAKAPKPQAKSAKKKAPAKRVRTASAKRSPK